MKKIIWGILFLGILCSGCMKREFEMDWDKINAVTIETEGQTDYVPETDGESEEISDNLSTMQKAVLGVEMIYDTADGKMKWIWELPNYVENSKFQYCDMDGDGKGEVIFEWYEFPILHEKEGVIYRYSTSSRNVIYDDGYIMYKTNDSSWCIMIVKEFTSEEIVYETILQYEDGVYYKEYVYNGECILMTKDELDAFNEQYKGIRKKYQNNYKNIIYIIR